VLSTTVIRHPKERLSKCSLEPLRQRQDLCLPDGQPAVHFLKARPALSFQADGFTLLSLDAPPLSLDDGGRPLLLLDATWRLLPALKRCVKGKPVCRTLPGHYKTAYPRLSKLDAVANPEGGLASIEALYLAWRLLGHDCPQLLDDYHWRAEFLSQFSR
jgi:pre-rRNA-processing protein TSR3